jgi:hypothetical protein
MNLPSRDSWLMVWQIPCTSGLVSSEDCMEGALRSTSVWDRVGLPIMGPLVYLEHESQVDWTN